MTEFLYNFHSGWRFLVIAMTVIVFAFFLYAYFSKATSYKQERIFLAAWAGIVDIQVTLGIILVVLYLLDDLFYNQLIGHVVMGFIIAIAAHVPTLYKRFNGDPSDQVRRIMGIVLPVVAFLFVFISLAAIERGLFEMLEKSF